jgi:hypothetical protein
LVFSLTELVVVAVAFAICWRPLGKFRSLLWGPKGASLGGRPSHPIYSPGVVA